MGAATPKDKLPSNSFYQNWLLSVSGKEKTRVEKRNKKGSTASPQEQKLFEKLEGLTVSFLAALISEQKQLVGTIPTVDKFVCLSRQTINKRYQAFTTEQNGGLFAIREKGASGQTLHHNIFSNCHKVRSHKCAIELKGRDYCRKCVREAELRGGTGRVYHARVRNVLQVIDYLLKEADSVAWFLKKIDFKEQAMTAEYRHIIRKAARKEKAAWYRTKQRLGKRGVALGNNDAGD